MDEEYTPIASWTEPGGHAHELLQVEGWTWTSFVNEPHVRHDASGVWMMVTEQYGGRSVNVDGRDLQAHGFPNYKEALQYIETRMLLGIVT
jgi:hypothetical protein